MITTIERTAGNAGGYDAVVIPFSAKGEYTLSLGPQYDEAVKALAASKAWKPECGTVLSRSVFADNKFAELVLVSLGDGTASKRQLFLAMAKAFRKCRSVCAKKIAVFLDHAKEITNQKEAARKFCELPHLVSYQFPAYKSAAAPCGFEEVSFITEMPGFEEIVREAETVARGTLLARDLVNHPSMYMTPNQLAEEAVKVGSECGIEVEILRKPQIEALHMGAFLAVARGADDEPVVIVMRYRGDGSAKPPVALIGKGVMFDSGGYSMKSKMATMHDDMGGAAAVIGAMQTIALMKLPTPVVGVIAACKNMISGKSYVPGDILRSMNGKTIEMLNADAEGRLTLADAITYAVRREGAETLIDIATLTGAAKTSVGGNHAVLLASNETLAETVETAARTTCEQVWRLPEDEELLTVLKSEAADIKSSNPGNTMGGGSIVAGLFIREFTEGKPWAHIDMAPVNWSGEGNAYSSRGGTGYGAGLLYETVKRLEK